MTGYERLGGPYKQRDFSPAVLLNLTLSLFPFDQPEGPHVCFSEAMDAAQVLQTVLSVIQSQNGGAGGADANTTTTPTASSPQCSPSNASPLAQAGSLSLPQLLFALLSTGAVRDWARLFLMGALLETCRRVLTKVWEESDELLWLTATFEWSDETSGACVLVVAWCVLKAEFADTSTVVFSSASCRMDQLLAVTAESLQ